jgi:hypothetical protein
MKTTRRDKELFESQHYNRKLARPLTFPFSRSFSAPLNGRVSDPDALAYISLLAAQGVVVTDVQSSALHAFFVTAKEQEFLTHIKRAFFPVWGVVAANAVCMVSRTSGLFSGDVTHSAGFIEGDGGYLNPGTDAGLDDFGLTQINCHQAVLIQTAATGDGPIAANEEGGKRFSIRADTSAVDTTWLLYQVEPSAARITGENDGVFVGTGNAGVSTTLLHLGGDGTETENTATQTATTANALPSNQPFLLSRSLGGGGSSRLPTDAHVGFWSYGTTLHSKRSEYAAAMKTLWETCTGLTLP